MGAEVEIQGIDKLMEELDRLAVGIVKGAKNYTEKEIPERYARILSMYYADYEPNSYVRTGQLYSRSFMPYSYSSDKGLRAFAGILLTPQDMSYKTRYPSEQVIEDYLEGWHGGYQAGIPASFNPRGLVQSCVRSVVDEICHGNVGEGIIATAKSKAKLQMLK